MILVQKSVFDKYNSLILANSEKLKSSNSMSFSNWYTFLDINGQDSSIYGCFNIVSYDIKYKATEPQEFHYILDPWQFTRYNAYNRVQINNA